MAEIIWGAPLVDYAQFQIHATSEELGLKDVSDGYTLAYAYGLWLGAVRDGFAAGVAAANDPAQKKLNVTGQYQESPEPEPMPERTPAQEAEEAEQTIKTMLGATTVEPWTKTPAPSSTPKAWDNFDI